MSGHTTSYRWAGVTRANVGGLVRHNARDVDLMNGVEVTHSNDDINPAMTQHNETMVNNGSGKLIPCTNSKQWMAFLDKRISEAQNIRTLKDGSVVPVAVRKDASVAVEFVLQLDPDFTGATEDLTAEKFDEVNRLLDVMVEEVVQQMGAENIIGYSKHWDEGHPHVQLMAVPVTEDGKLSMKQKLGAPTKAGAQAKYSKMHDSMRSTLRAAGYDATDERVDAGKRHLGLAEFKKQRDHEAEIESQARKNGFREKELDRYAGNLNDREVKLKTRSAAMDDREVSLEARELNVAQKGSEADLLAVEARRALRAAKELREATEADRLALGVARDRYDLISGRLENVMAQVEAKYPVLAASINDQVKLGAKAAFKVQEFTETQVTSDYQMGD